MKTLSFTFCIIISFFFCNEIYGQGYEFGDAPEMVIAYPSTGTIGLFPTCKTVGANTHVQHNNFGAVLGPAFDLEGDGNGGICPGFAPYDNDECFADSDAGLIIPEPFTIVNNAVVPCPNSMGTSLGSQCNIGTWGGNVDIMVANNMPGQTDGLMNVVIDFNQNGMWGDMVTCPNGAVPEHILQDFLVPWGYSGPLSGLGPPAFTIGPNTGFVWARFTISEQHVGPNWNGQGAFEDGESEDYLLQITIMPGIIEKTDCKVLDVKVYPNPAEQECTINIDLYKDGNVLIEIYDVYGKKIKDFGDALYKAGNYDIVWDGCDDKGQSLGAGVFVVQVILDGATAEKAKVLLIK